MKKLFLSWAFIISFAGYSVYHYFGHAPTQPILPPESMRAGKGAPSSGTKQLQISKNQKTNRSGKYADGTYIGRVADAYYGNVQVEAVVSGGVISDVKFLQYPSDRSTSVFINGQAMPILSSEAVSSQNSNVDIVSGATDTSMAFRQSLSDALTQAKG